MKVILTGTTGFIGTEVLSQALSHPSITSLLVLSRRALPSPFPSDPKLRVVILEDFMNIPDQVMRDLEGCEGCIWFVHVPSFSIFPLSDYAPWKNPKHISAFLIVRVIGLTS